MPPKKAKGKKGKPALGDWSDDDAPVVDPLQGSQNVEQEEDAAEPAAQPARAPKAKKKGKKGKNTKLDWSDDEQPAAAASSALASDAEDEPPRRSSSGGSRGAAGFAALPSEDEGEVDAPATNGTEAGDASDDGSEELPEPIIGRITKVSKHPKADRLKVCQVDGGARSGSMQVVTNAAVSKGQMVIVAPAGCTTPGSAMRVEAAQMRGVDSSGMICSAYDLGWSEEPDGVPAFVPKSAALGSPYPDEPFSEEPEEEAVPAAKPKGGKGKKSKKDISFDLLDDDEDAAAAAPADEPAADRASGELRDESEGEEELQLGRKPKKGKKKKSKSSISFDLLDEDENEEVAAPDDAEAPAANGSSAALREDDSEGEELQLERKPKKDKKKKKSKKDISFDRLDEDEEAAPDSIPEPAETSAPAAGAEAAAAPDADGEEAFLGGGKKGKKKKGGKKALADMDSAFAALDVGEQQPSGQPAEPPGANEDADEPLFLGGSKSKRKKKKSSAAVDWAALEADGGEAEPAAEAEHPSASGQPEAVAPPEPPAASCEHQGGAPAAKGKGGKGGKSAAEAEEIDALLAELDAPEQPAAEAAGGGKKKKKKKGGAAEKPAEEEDLDAILAELGGAPPAAAPTAPAEPPAGEAAAAMPAEAAPAADEAAEGADEDAAEEGGKELSAAAKKKAKRKAKEKAAKAGGEAAAAAPAAAAAEKGKPKKVSAAVRAMQEAQEARLRAEEAARQAEEERRRQEEEEERRAAEEAEAKAKREAERKERRAAQRAQLKKEGKLLSGKQKAEAERLARVREQMLANANLPLPGEGEAAPVRKKVVYTSKKKQQPKKQPSDAAAAVAEAEAQQQAEAEAAERARKQAEEEEQQRQQAEAAAAAEARSKEEEAEAAAVESSDGEDWDAVDPMQIELPAQREARLKAEQAEADRAAAAAAAKEAEQLAAAEAAEAAARKAAEPQPMEEDVEEEEEEEEEESEEESGSEDEESEEDSESETEYSSSYESETDSEEARQERIAASRAAREQRVVAARAAASMDDLRSPICCILGHVDTGKTKILDNVRRTNVQDGEAGGITQQIGATYVPATNIRTRTEQLRSEGEEFDLRVPGLLIIDTPGHESFTNLRSRGSSLCDIAILVVDLMHSLEPQTIESINLLKQRKTPFIIALNKVDRLYGWKTVKDRPIQAALAVQDKQVLQDFEDRLKQVKLELMEQGLNTELYWKNTDMRSFVNIVPTSAITGEGIPDLLQMLVQLTQSRLAQRLMFINELQATVLEVKVIEGLGTTMDVVLVNGLLREGAQIVVCGLGAPIVTTIRSLLTPHPMKELRVKGSYLHHKEVKAAQGIKIAANGLESAVAGTQLLVVGPGDDVELLKEEVMSDMADIFSSVDKGGEGVCVQASTLGSLEALLTFLKSDAVQIPVSGINIGPIHKKDVMRASVMLEKGAKKFAVILAFDVPVNREAQQLAESMGVRIFTADIIYHLFDQFTAYLKQVKEEEQEAARFDAVFPCVLSILPTCIFNKKDPIVLGVEVVEGIAKVGTPVCVPSQGFIDLGRIASMELNHKAVNIAKRGDSVAMKLEPGNTTEASRLYGRHFDFKDELVSRISRKSIDLLKEHFRNDLSRDDWKLVVKLKSVFQIQ